MPTWPDEGFVSTEVVQQLALGGAARERLKFVLAVNIDEDVSQLAQQLHGDRLPVEVRARAAVGRDDAAHGKLPVCADRLLFEPSLQLARARA